MILPFCRVGRLLSDCKYAYHHRHIAIANRTLSRSCLSSKNISVIRSFCSSSCLYIEDSINSSNSAVHSNSLNRLAYPDERSRNDVAHSDQNGGVIQIKKTQATESSQSIKEFSDLKILHGWIRSVRRQKNTTFIMVSDANSSHVWQVVIATDKVPRDLSVASSVCITGKIVPSRGTGQKNEWQASHIQIIGGSDAATWPLQNKYHSPAFIREFAHLRSRSALISQILRLRSRLFRQISNYFEGTGYILCHPPVLTSSDCEGAGDTFAVIKPGDPKYWGLEQKAFLTVSSQLHLEALMMGLGSVWCLNPAFRAEASLTNRHISEFWMCEVEMAFCSTLDNLMKSAQYLIQSVIRGLAEDSQWLNQLKQLHSVRNEQMSVNTSAIFPEELEQRWKMLLTSDWTFISYEEAIEKLKEHNNEFAYPAQLGSDLQTEHEKFLTDSVFNGPVFVYRYPKSLKPFYMLESEAPSKSGIKTCECFDLLIPQTGEIVGGSLREHDEQRLIQQMKEHRIDIAPLQWYVDLRKWGTIPHGGYGLGVERLLMYIAGVENVREVLPFPRSFQNCRF